MKDSSNQNFIKRIWLLLLSVGPDVLFIDYALNDRWVEMSEAYHAWDEMIKKAKSKINYKKNIC